MVSTLTCTLDQEMDKPGELTFVEEHREPTSVPALRRNLLWHVCHTAIGVEVCPQEGRDRCFIRNASISDSAITYSLLSFTILYLEPCLEHTEEARNKVRCTNDQSCRRRIEVEIGVRVTRVSVVACKVTCHSFDVVLATSIGLCEALQVEKHTGVEVVVVT